MTHKLKFAALGLATLLPSAALSQAMVLTGEHKTVQAELAKPAGTTSCCRPRS